MPITGMAGPSSLGLTDEIRNFTQGQGPSSGGSVTDAASITRAQWQHFLDQYRPVEEEVIRNAMDTDLSQEGDQAGLTAAAGVRSSRGILARNLSRSGARLSAEERAALRRRTGSALARSVGRAENVTRRGLADARTSQLQGIVNLGRGVATTASGGLNAAADMAAQREALFQQQRAGAHSTNLSSAASAAALLIAFV